MFLQTKRTIAALVLILHAALLFSQDTTHCVFPTFYETRGQQDFPEYATAILQGSDQNIYIAGRDGNETFIQKMKPSGEIVWTRTFFLSAFEPITPSELIEDSDGMLVGAGTQGIPGLSKGCVFRYDPNTNTMLWLQSVTSNNPMVGGVVEASTGGNFLLYQTAMLINGRRDAEILEIDRNTGAVNPGLAKRYKYIDSDVFTKMISVNGGLFVTGWSVSRYNTTVNARRQLLMRLDPGTLNPVWAHINHLDTLAQVSFFGRDLIADGDTLVMAYGGGSENFVGGATSDTIYLQKSDMNGDIVWVKKYDVAADVYKLLNLPDGYLIYGQHNGNEHIAIKTDKQGNTVWARKLTDGPTAVINAGNLSPSQAVVMGDSLYLTGIATNNSQDVFLWKLLANGDIGTDTCSVMDTLLVNATSVTNHFRVLADFSTVFSTATGVNSTPSVFETTMERTQVCPECSVPVDPCPQHNDFIVTLDGTTCNQGKVNLNYTVCDLNGGAVDPLNLVFYNGNPFTTVADKIYSTSFSPVSGDSCHSGVITDIVTKLGTDNVQEGDVIYVLVNAAPNASTPIDPNAYPFDSQEECDYANNLGQFVIHYPDAPALNLGADRTVCPNTTVTLDAGPGYFKYQWSNGATTQTTTAPFSGQYRVTVTDDCGLKQTDTVNVTILTTPVLTENGSFCPGKSVTIRGFTFDHAGIFQHTVPGFNGDCDTLATFFIDQLPYQTHNETILFCPGDTITINGVQYWESGLAKDTITGIVGCDTIIFYFLQQLPRPFRTKLVFICPGDSVEINGHFYNNEVVVNDTIPSMSSAGCDTIIYYNIQFLPEIAVYDTIRFCPGTSVTLNGQVYDMPGTVEMTIPSSDPTTCDTILHYILEWLPSPTQHADVFFCQGDSIVINGAAYTQEGDVSFTIAGPPGGCDTIVTYTLHWRPTPVRDEDVMFCQGGSVTINGELYTQPGAVQASIPGQAGECDTLVTYHLSWLPTPTRAEDVTFCQGKSVTIAGQVYTQPGTVQATIPGQAGECDTLVTYTLSWLPTPTLAEEITFCPGTTVTIDGNTYSQPGTVQSTIPGTGGGCDTLVTYTLTVLPYQSGTDTLRFCPGQSVTIGGNVYTQPGTVVDTLSATSGDCDVIITYILEFSPLPTRAQTIEFCEGSSITLGGQNYTQPGTVVLTAPGINGACDTVVTYTLQYVVPDPSTLTVKCPFNVNIATAPGTGPVPVTYSLPTAQSDCTCPGVAWTLTQGLPSGSLFSPGMTHVCYTGRDSCGSTASCCFDVMVREEAACETKTNGCLKYEIFSITADAQQRYTYRIRVTNMCANKLIYTAIQLPDGVVAVSPANNSMYTSPEGLKYQVRNPNFTPFYSIRFLSASDSISNGESVVLEFTLPQQVHPLFFDITSRLVTQSYYEAHINTFNCPIGVTNHNRDETTENVLTEGEKTLLLFPNPTDGALFADLSDWSGEQVDIRVLDSRGDRVLNWQTQATGQAERIPLPEQMPAGLYFLEMKTAGGESVVARFVKQ